MTPTEQKTAARNFAAFWTGKGYERGQTQPFYAATPRPLRESRGLFFLPGRD